MQNSFPTWKVVHEIVIPYAGSYVELAALLAVGALSAVAVVVPPAKRQTARKFVQLISIIVFFFFIASCLGVFGLIRNPIYGLSLIGRENVSCLHYMGISLAIICLSLVVGPFFCGWICPTGTLQEAVCGLFKRTRDREKRPALSLTGIIALSMVFLIWIHLLYSQKIFFAEDSNIYWTAALLVLLVAVWFGGKVADRRLRVLRKFSFMLVVAITTIGLSTSSPVHFVFSNENDPASVLSTVIIILAALLVSRAWCRYLCPWGWLMGKIATVSSRKIEVDESLCIRCGRCNIACGPEAIEEGNLQLSACIHCCRCVDVCPTRAVTLADKWNPAGGKNS